MAVAEPAPAEAPAKATVRQPEPEKPEGKRPAGGELAFSANALTVLQKRYLRKDNRGQTD